MKAMFKETEYDCQMLIPNEQFIGKLGEIHGWRQYSKDYFHAYYWIYFFQVRCKSSIQNNNFPVF